LRSYRLATGERRRNISLFLGRPLSKELFCLENLRHRHALTDCVADRCRSAGSLRGRQAGPQVCRNVILPDPFSLIIQSGEIGLRLAVALFGGAPVPDEGFCQVLADTAAMFVHARQIVLAAGIALLGGHPKPAHRVGVALGNPGSLLEEDAKIALREGMPRLGRALIPLGSQRPVLRDSAALSIEDTEVELCSRMTFLSNGPEFMEGRDVIPMSIGFDAHTKIGRRGGDAGDSGEKRREADDERWQTHLL